MNSFERLYNTINRKPPVNVIAQDQPHSGKNKKPVKSSNHFVQQVNKYRKLKFKAQPENIPPSGGGGGGANYLGDKEANDKIKQQKEEAKKAEVEKKLVQQKMDGIRDKSIKDDK